MKIKIYNEEKALIIISVFSVLLSFGKVMHSGYLTFLTLSWNLLLAWIPYLISRYGFQKEQGKNTKNIIFFIIWILFLPNAPYLITDFIHLNIKGPYRWLEIVIFSSYGLSGLLLFQLSILHFKNIFLSKYSKITRQFIIVFLSGICAYGIYLGRILRCNSWEIVSDPIGLAHSIFNSIFHNPNLFNAFYINVIFTLFLYISIIVFNYLLNTNDEKKN